MALVFGWALQSTTQSFATVVVIEEEGFALVPVFVEVTSTGVEATPNSEVITNPPADAPEKVLEMLSVPTGALER